MQHVNGVGTDKRQAGMPKVVVGQR